MLDNLKKYQIILASNSPRRKELMSGLGVDYVVRTLPDVDESYPDTLVGAEIPEYIAREKADAYRTMMQPGELLITADTIVWMDGKVLGKPEGREGAIEMLRALSGKSHQVFTGVCLTTTEWQKSFTASSETFKECSKRFCVSMGLMISIYCCFSFLFMRVKPLFLDVFRDACGHKTAYIFALQTFFAHHRR